MNGNVISAKDFGKGLAEYLSQPVTADDWDSELSVDRSLFASEKMYLEIFATDYSAYMHFGDDPVRREIMDSFYKNFTGAVQMTAVNEHLGTYGNAMQIPPPTADLSKFWNVGKAFAHYCGRENDLYVISKGIVLIQRSLTGRLDAYQQFQIES